MSRGKYWRRGEYVDVSRVDEDGDLLQVRYTLRNDDGDPIRYSVAMFDMSRFPSVERQFMYEVVDNIRAALALVFASELGHVMTLGAWVRRKGTSGPMLRVASVNRENDTVRMEGSGDWEPADQFEDPA